MTNPQIKSWSYSRLGDFETCAYRAKLKIIDKIPEPERPLKPGQTEHANDRGTRIHDEIEKYIRGRRKDIPVEAAKHFKAEIESLRARFIAKTVSLEGEWGFNREWEIAPYPGAWLRMKCDAVIHMSPKHIVVVDYKTGRKFGNEIKHGEQVQLYALAAAIRYPEVDIIDVELWYLDQDELTHETKPIKKWLYHLKPFNNRGLKMTNATEFKANPSSYACKWCPYKDSICEYAYVEPTATKPVRRKGQPV